MEELKLSIFSPIAVDAYGEPILIETTRKGFHGIDLARAGYQLTEWDKISKIIVNSTNVILVEKTQLIDKDESGKIYIKYFVTPEELEARKLARKNNPSLEETINENGEYIYKILLPEDSSKDNRVINVWVDIQSAVILWARQSGVFGRMRDKRFVYNMNIPDFVFTTKPKIDSNVKKNSSFVEDKKMTLNFSVRQTYATKEEFLKEVQDLMMGHLNKSYINPEGIKEPKKYIPSPDWRSLNLSGSYG